MRTSAHELARPVVVGVNGSPETLPAIAWAVEYAMSTSAPLRLVAAYQPDALEEGVMTAGTGTSNGSSFRQACRHTEDAARYVRSLQPTLQVETACVAKGASEVLLTEAQHAAVVVIGHRRLGRLHRAVSGSTGAATSTRASCPLIVVRERASRSLRGMRVIVGIDGPESGRAAEFAFSEARRLGAGLTAVHAWALEFADLSSLMAPTAGREDLEGRSRRLLSQVIDPISSVYPDVDVRKYAAPGSAPGLLDKLSMNAMLLVVGSRGLNPVSAVLFGSVSRTMITRAHCPLAVVHSTAPATAPARGVQPRHRERSPLG
jgi:nucleotide-binding universal stress UspA family protein